MSPQSILDPHAESADDQVLVTVAGRTFTGWKAVRIDRAIDAAAGQFILTTAVQPSPERHAGEYPTPGAAFPMKPGDRVVVHVGAPGSGRTQVLSAGASELAQSETLVTGHVDSLQAIWSEDGHELVYSGRDLTADLIDCSAENEPGEWVNVRFIDLVRQIARPFGVGVVLDPLLGEKLSTPFGDIRGFSDYALNEGETAFAAIERACRLRGLLCYGLGDGRLMVATVPQRQADAALVQGANVQAAQLDYSTAERFSTILVRGQGRGSDLSYGVAVAQIEGRATDGEISRTRPIRIIAEGLVDESAAQARAEWEATVRAARSATARVTVQGWRQVPGGRPWAVNELVQAHLPAINLSATFLVASVRFERNEDTGSTTKLELVRRDAFTPEPAVPEDPSFGSVLSDDSVEDLLGEDGL